VKKSPILVLLVLLLLLSASGLLSDPVPHFTIPEIMGAPFASELVAAPRTSRVAWLQNEAGRRNVWIAEAPQWTGRRVTHFDQDDGQDIADLEWAPDARVLLFVRGGDFENGGENPNPDFAVSKPEQQIWSVALDGAPPKKLTEGHAPHVSPDGATIAFLRGGQIFTMSSAGQDVKNAVTQKGSQSDLQWSPQGNALAFVSTRQGHSFIGVYSPAAKSLRYFDPSVDRDSEPVWSSDGAQLAYVRVPASSPRIGPAPRRSGEPWSIRITDVQTGEPRQVFKAEPGPGSVFHQIVAAHQVWWAGENLIFPWERTGWCHLYTVAVRCAQPPRELTPGEGEVEHVGLSPDDKLIYFSANFKDIDRRHIWSVSTQSSAAPQLLTPGEQIEWAPAPLADGSALLFLASSYNQRSHAMLRLPNGEKKPLVSEAPGSASPAAALIKPQMVLLTAADGMRIHGQLFLPPAGEGGTRHPALLFFHGGSRRQMLLGFHYMYYYSNAYSLNQYLASQGYVVLSVNYRSGIGYGLDFREALNYGASGGSEFNDVIGAGLYLKSRPNVDPERIGVWGGSYGGYLTALALARASDLFQAGVDFHGVHDWSSLRDNPVVQGGDTAEEQEYRQALRVAFESSPLASVDTWKSPVLLIHGDDDRNVSFSQTVKLAEALRKRHVEFEELIFPNEIHDFLRHQDWVKAYQATAGFFSRKLAPPKAVSEVR
jgi:dipeptidyl aminopeptidase/acylaminoacyl peptidase